MILNNEPSGFEILKLAKRVVAGFNSSNWVELGMLTETQDSIDRHPRLLRSLSFADEDYDGHAMNMIKSIIQARPENYNLLKQYVAETCPEAGQLVSSGDGDGRKIVFSPSVFKVPIEEVNPKLVSVMMPFETSLKPVYDEIQSAASAVGLSCQRADDIWTNSTVIQDVFSLIFQSNIVVCDFTGRNPNVFYEAGIAHTLGKHVIPITQHQSDVPFDLQHHRYALYLNNAEGLGKLRATLETRFRTLVQPIFQL